ncbi:MAG: hypothetical protein ABJA64_02025 [Candidatus Saccharibacteria bacterium]
MTERALYFSQKAFALPTVLITSVVMIIVMLSAITATVSVNNAIDAQYYNKLAQESGESGVAMATGCIKQNDSTAWTNPLQPGTDCNGNGTASYILNTPNIRTSFSIPTPTIGANGSVSLAVSSKVELLRTSNGLPWKTQLQATNATVVPNNFNISSGNDTTCATVNGKLWCWGLNDYGQVGNGTQTDQLMPFNVNNGALSGKYIYQGTSGLHHTCAIAGPDPSLAIGTSKAYCWGDNSLAQMGIGAVGGGPYLTPIAAASLLPTDRAYSSISAGNTTCVIGTNNVPLSSVWCWGENGTAQAGSDFNVSAYSPKKNPTDDTISGGIRYATSNSTSDSSGNSALLPSVTQVNLVNSSMSCALTNVNTAYCWGSNNSGTMGIGVTGNSGVERRWRARLVGSSSATSFTSSARFTKIVTNFGRVCAVGKLSGTTTLDGKLYCWGANGEAGNPDYRMSSALSSELYGSVTAIATAGTATFSDIALADWTTCAIGSNGVYAGNVYCWGYNNAGQLGNGTVSGVTPANGVTPSTANKPVAPSAMVQVTGALTGKTVVKLTSGNDHFCAMTASGASYCWGRNDHGQLGDGTTTNRSSPVRTGVPVAVTLF